MDNINDRNFLTAKNRVSFALAGLGQNLIIGLVNSYLLFFYTNIYLLGAAPAGILMIVARIWDALNDPFMGAIVDKTKTKFGKMRPYILYISLPLALSTASLFIIPRGVSDGFKIAYAYITYILWGMIYTVCDVPFWGLASAMTPNPRERISFISQSRLVHGIGGALPTVIIPVVTKLLGDRTGYTVAGILVGLIGGGLFLLAFTGTTERTAPAEKSPTIKDCVNFLKINKPLQSVVGANVLGFMRALPIVAGIYVATYILKGYEFTVFGKVISLNGTALNTLIIAGFGVSGFIGMILTPVITKFLNYRQIYYVSALIGVITSVSLYFAGPSLFLILLCLTISGFPYGVVTNINYAMIADSVEYVEWKTGMRTEGVTVSFQTLMNKMMSALQIGLVALALIVIKFVEPIETDDHQLITLPQSGFTLRGFFWLITILPAIGWALSVIPIYFYRFTGKQRERAHRELARSRMIKQGLIKVITLPEKYKKYLLPVRQQHPERDFE